MLYFNHSFINIFLWQTTKQKVLVETVRVANVRITK